MSYFFNSSNCPGTDVILELLRAEHEQVKQRTEIIRQLISYNCTNKPDSVRRNSSPRATDMIKNLKNSQINLSQSISNFSKEFNVLQKIDSLGLPSISSYSVNFDPINQRSSNNWESRHEKCFLPYEDSLNSEKPNRLQVNAFYSRLSQGQETYRPSNNQVKGNKPTLPSYSTVLREDIAAVNKKVLPSYSQYKKDTNVQQITQKRGRNLHEVSTKNVKSSPTRSMKQSPSPKGIRTVSNQTDGISKKKEVGENTKDSYDYKFEAYKLLQEVADLKQVTRKYEEEKSDWIHEKRQQIRILQELRDASCEETQAGMQLTSWKPSEIECNPKEYEEAKRKWLLCKKLQIELLEKLRSVSLCEIKRSIQKIAVPETMDIDCSKLDKPKPCIDSIDNNKPYSQELFSSEKFAVRICSPVEKNECIDKDKININIMMKSNSNVLKTSSHIPELCETAFKGSPFKSLKQDSNNSGILKDEKLMTKKIKKYEGKPEVNISSLRCVNEKNNSVLTEFCQNDHLEELSIDELKKTLENKIGRKLFQNTYNLLKQLNCPDLILQSTNGDPQVAEIVFNYIIQEKKFTEKSKPV